MTFLKLAPAKFFFFFCLIYISVAVMVIVTICIQGDLDSVAELEKVKLCSVQQQPFAFFYCYA